VFIERSEKGMKKGIVIGVLLALFIGFLSLSAFAEDEQVVMIGHASIPDSLKKEEIKQIFLGRKTRWANDEKIIFVIFAEENTYKTFLKEYVGKTIFQYKNYWKKQVFTGKGRMPKAFRKSDDVIKFMSDTKGTISFVMANDVDLNTVKIISVEP